MWTGNTTFFFFFFTALRYAYGAVFAVVRYSSVTLVDCIHTAEDIVILLSQPGSRIILVFRPPANTQFREELQRGAKYTGVGQLRFSTEIAVYLGYGTR